MAEAGDSLGIARDDIMSTYDYTSPTSPTGNNFASFSQPNGEFGQRPGESRGNPSNTYGGTGSSASHYSYDMKSDSTHDGDVGSQAHEPLVVDHSPQFSTSPRTGSNTSAMRITLPPRTGPPRAQSTFSLYSEALISVPLPIRAPIPAGYALAQLLPSRMLRLTLRLPKPFRWAAGQK